MLYRGLCYSICTELWTLVFDIFMYYGGNITSGTAPTLSYIELCYKREILYGIDAASAGTAGILRYIEVYVLSGLVILGDDLYLSIWYTGQATCLFA